MNEYEKLDLVLGYLNEQLILTENQLVIKKNESVIVTFLNKISKEFYNKDKENYISNKSYDWRRVITAAPTISKKLDYRSNGKVVAIFGYSEKHNIVDSDSCDFFESDLVKYINKSKDKILNKFKFSSEDIGIIIDVK